MKAFLEHIIDDIAPEEVGSLRTRCFVFPTRRACLYFSDLLKARFKESPFWAPDVLSIEDFITRQSNSVSGSELTLIFELFRIYRKHDPSIVFESFYSWAQVLLRDFDEIDRYLADPKNVYKNLQDIKDLEAEFGPNPEMLEALKQFQLIIDVTEATPLIQQFRETWSLVGKVYFEFQSRLANANLAYSGMLYRQLAEKLQAGASVNYSHVVFAGFNAISKSEEEIFDVLVKEGKATLYWDADSLYLNEEDKDKFDAAKFLWRHKSKWKANSKWIVSQGFEEDKTIDIVGAPQAMAQSKYASTLVEDMVQSGENKVALVLADEGLLFPLLYALPPLEKDLNVTMGYPVNTSALYSFAHLYAMLQSSKRTSSSGVFYETQLVLHLLVHPLVAGQMHAVDSELLKKVRKTKSEWFLIKELKNSLLLKLFEPLDSPSQILNNLETILVRLIDFEKNDTGQLDKEIAFHFISHIRQLADVVEQERGMVNLKTLVKILVETTKQLKVPFFGEPLAGVQLMGFLETRTLDFENLVILSANEGKIPAAQQVKTYIPNGVRKAFGLPIGKDQDAIYAYHFYRLIQRAKRITILYNSELAIDGSGEKSRFILQLLNSLGQKENIKLTESSINSPMTGVGEVDKAIVVRKTDSVMERLETYSKDASVPKGLAPTALADYINCSLQFYFKRIAKLKEKEIALDAGIDAREFGNIVHKTLEELYKPFIGKEVLSSDLDEMTRTGLDHVLELSFEEVVHGSRSGKNLFQKGLIKAVLQSVLQEDKTSTPFKILAIETKELTYELSLQNGRKVLLGGAVDRIDEVDTEFGKLSRIIDYKTGTVELVKGNKNKSLVDYVEKHFDEPKFKTGFQALFYANLFNKHNPNKKVGAGIYGMKEMNKGVSYLNSNGNNKIPGPVSEELLMEFEKNLQVLLEELFDTTIPFRQTEDWDRCKYCSFKSMCGR